LYELSSFGGRNMDTFATIESTLSWTSTSLAVRNADNKAPNKPIKQNRMMLQFDRPSRSEHEQNNNVT
jgi:hypothetical protein